MNDYNKITALYSRLSVGDEDRDGGESNSIQNQKKFLESYARQLKLTNIRHYIDDDESGRFFDRSAYSRMIEDVENGKIGVCTGTATGALRHTSSGRTRSSRISALRKSSGCTTTCIILTMWRRRTPGMRKPGTKSRYGRFRISSFLISGFIAIPPCPCS